MFTKQISGLFKNNHLHGLYINFGAVLNPELETKTKAFDRSDFYQIAHPNTIFNILTRDLNVYHNLGDKIDIKQVIDGIKANPIEEYNRQFKINNRGHSYMSSNP